MLIKRDLFRIESGAREADGTKLEPEQQAVQHVMQGSAPIGLGAGLEIAEPGAAGAIGSIPLEIVAHSDAQKVARSVSALCGNCRHFRNEAWRKLVARAEGPLGSPADKHMVQQVRGQLILHMPDPDQHWGEDDNYDVEHGLNAMGLCEPLREFYKAKDKIDEPHVVWPTSGCPQEVCTPDKMLGFFVPKDGDARKASAANFDAVMQRAAGKVL